MVVWVMRVWGVGRLWGPTCGVVGDAGVGCGEVVEAYLWCCG